MQHSVRVGGRGVGTAADAAGGFASMRLVRRERNQSQACCQQFRNICCVSSLTGTSSGADWILECLSCAFIGPAGFLGAVSRLQLRNGGCGGGGGVLTDRPWPRWSPGRKREVGEEGGGGGGDGCTDSYFSYNFLQAGLRLSGGEKAPSA